MKFRPYEEVKDELVNDALYWALGLTSMQNRESTPLVVVFHFDRELYSYEQWDSARVGVMEWEGPTGNPEGYLWGDKIEMPEIERDLP